MKSGIGARAASSLLAAALPWMAASPAGAGPSVGAVYVTTLPAGADVWVDGTYVGRAPVLVDALAAGHHALTITRTGWIVQEVDVTVPPGGVAMSSTHLAAGPRAFNGTASGTVVIRQVPAGANLLLDGETFTAAPGRPVTLPAGLHHIVAVTPKGRITRPFTVLPDTPTQLVIGRDAAAPEARAAVLAPADDYIGADAYTIEGSKIVLRSAGHLVVAHFGVTSMRLDGVPVAYDAAPTSIGGKLYMPLALLEKLSDDMSKAH